MMDGSRKRVGCEWQHIRGSGATVEVDSKPSAGQIRVDPCRDTRADNRLLNRLL